MKIEGKHIVIGILIVMALNQLGYIDLEPYLPARIQPTEVVTTVPIACNPTITPDIDINAFDVDNPTTAVTDANNLYRKKPSGTWTTWTLGTEITNLDVGSTYEFFIPGDLTTSNIKAKAFGKYIIWTVPCKEDEEMTIYVAQDETYDNLLATFLNANGQAAAETFTVAQNKTIKLRWRTKGSDEYYGHPYLETYPMLSDNGNHRRQYPNILCLNLNTTSWEIPDQVFLDDMTIMNKIPAPTITVNNATTTHNMHCYEAPVMTDRNTDIYVTLEADATVAPLVDDTAYLYAGNLYINSDTGNIEWGVEDNDAVATAGNGYPDELTLDFT